MFEPLSDLVFKTVDSLHYRFGNQSARCGSSVASRIHRTRKKLDVHIKPYTCSGQDPIAFLGLFARLKRCATKKLLVREVLTNTELDAFRESKKRLVSPLILAPLRHGYQYVLDIDGCQNQGACMLLQERRNGDKPQNGCESRSLADGGDDISLNNEVQCFPVDGITHASHEKIPAVEK